MRLKTIQSQQISRMSGARPMPNLVAAAVVGLVGAALAYSSFAASIETAAVETEAGVMVGAQSMADAQASGGFASQFTATPQSRIHPGVVYTQADIDAWNTGNANYTKLAATGAACISSCAAKHTPVVFGAVINNNDASPSGDSTTELNAGLKDQSGFAKVQAVLYRADGNEARRTKVISYLEQYRTVTGFEWDHIEQYRLVAGWGCSNLAQAAELVAYRDVQFDRFLTDVCYPLLDWSNGPNWHAAFADAKLGIAAYVGSESLWADAKRYYYERIKQSIYYAPIDGATVYPMHTEDQVQNAGTPSSYVSPTLHAGAGTPSSSMTQTQWGKEYDPGNVGQVNANYTINSAFGAAVDGMNAERLRDLSHINLGLTGWMHGLRTLRAQGESVTPEYIQAYNRLKAGYSYHAQRVYQYAQSGTIPAPVPANGDGGIGRFMGYYGAQALFGADTPQSVLDMLGLTEVNTTYAATVSTYNVAEKFADGL